MVNESIVRRLLNNIEGYVTELRDADDIDFAKYISDIRSQRFVERTLQMTVEAVLDTVHHIISDEGFREPESYADAFSVLADHHVLTEDVASNGRLMAQFRNKVVHHYEKIDPEQVFGILSKHLGDFDLFVATIREWMDSQ